MRDRRLARASLHRERRRSRLPRHARGLRLRLSRRVLLAGARSSSTPPTACWRARCACHERLPWFDGAKLDDIVDYLTYVFVPALLRLAGAAGADAWTLPVACAMLLSSAYGFNRDDAKTTDHFFTGFPSYWNIVVFYLFLMHQSRLSMPSS